MSQTVRELNIFTLDGLAILLGDAPAPKLVSRKAEALLVYLASTGKGHGREFLADMLWDGRSRQQSLANLRVVLASLRRELGEYLEITRVSVSIRQDRVIWLDSHRLEEGLLPLLEGPELDSMQAISIAEEALALYREEFLKAFSIREAEGFEDWMRQERERINRLVVDALTLLTAQYMHGGESSAAMAAAKRLLLADPYSEIGHQHLIQLLYQDGHRIEAIAHYHAFQELLHTELGIEPSRQTTALYEEINHAGQETPPTRAGTALVRFPGHKLPSYPTSFVGRKRELTEIMQWLHHPDSHLMTLVGPGGVGKTRLALRVAEVVSDRFEGGVVFVDLAPISRPELVPGKIAQAFGIKQTSNRAIIDDLLKRLSSHRLLLVLDNFEQVIGAASLIGELIAATPLLRILVTSRESLRVYGELEYQVMPLTLPNHLHSGESHALMANESVALFVQRAQATDPGFHLTEDNVGDIATICIQLDGLPLAIELAAARVKIFRPRHLLAQLSDSLTNLRDGSRDTAPRHQTLQGAITWSYDLLEEDERILFSRLAVFRGGCTIEAAERVCEHDLNFTVTALLASLFNKSLILSREDANGELRFFTLETIHQYARHLLDMRAEAPEIHMRHANYFLALAQNAEPELRGPDQEAWSRRLRTDYDNLHAALVWSFSGAGIETGLRLVGAMSEFWYYEGPHADGMQWMSGALQEADTAPPHVHAKILNGAGMMAFVSGDFAQGEAYNRRALKHALKHQDQYNCAWAQFWLSAYATTDPGRYQEGYELIEGALELFAEIGDPSGLAWGYNQLGEVSRLMKDYARAQDAYTRSIEICQEIGHKRREGIALVNLSYVIQQQGNYALAVQEAQRGLSILADLELHYHTSIALTILVGPLSAQGKLAKAAKLYGAAQAQFEKIGNHLQPADQIEIDRSLEMVRERLHHDVFNTACDEGRKMPLEQAVIYALERSD